jgi:hypothetical protein
MTRHDIERRLSWITSLVKTLTVFDAASAGCLQDEASELGVELAYRNRAARELAQGDRHIIEYAVTASQGSWDTLDEDAREDLIKATIEDLEYEHRRASHEPEQDFPTSEDVGYYETDEERAANADADFYAEADKLADHSSDEWAEVQDDPKYQQGVVDGYELGFQEATKAAKNEADDRPF